MAMCMGYRIRAWWVLGPFTLLPVHTAGLHFPASFAAGCGYMTEIEPMD